MELQGAKPLRKQYQLSFFKLKLIVHCPKGEMLGPTEFFSIPDSTQHCE